jgi:hypothetical protein
MIVISLIVSFATAVIEFFLKDKAIVIISYGIIIPLVLLLPRIFYYSDSRIRNIVNLEWIRKTDFFAFFIVAFNAPGSLILHDLNFQYDRFLHFSAAFFSLIVFFLLWLPVSKMRKKEINKKKYLAFVFIALFFALFLWEGLQYSIDQIFGTKLFYDPSQPKFVDSSEDVFFGFWGLVAGVIYLTRKFDKITLSVWK